MYPLLLLMQKEDLVAFVVHIYQIEHIERCASNKWNMYTRNGNEYKQHALMK
jgi:hypothetical protein